MITDNNIKVAQSNLSVFLEKLGNSTESSEIVVKSRWPWKGYVVSVQPKSMSEWFLFFLKTLRFGTGDAEKHTALFHSIKTLTMYKEAVEYEFLASTPQWLSEEKSTLERIENSLNLLLKDSVSGMTGREKEHLRNLTVYLSNIPTCPLDQELHQLLKTPNQKLRGKIFQVKKNISTRKGNIPQLMKEAVGDAEKFFQTHAPKQKPIEKEVIAKCNSLFDFLIQEKPRPEIDKVYDQLESAAKIWKQVKDKPEYRKAYQQQFEELNQFFENKIKDFGPAKDIIFGASATGLFVS